MQRSCGYNGPVIFLRGGFLLPTLRFAPLRWILRLAIVPNLKIDAGATHATVLTRGR
jgi:hypothetical protein